MAMEDVRRGGVRGFTMARITQQTNAQATGQAGAQALG